MEKPVVVVAGRRRKLYAGISAITLIVVLLVAIVVTLVAPSSSSAASEAARMNSSSTGSSSLNITADLVAANTVLIEFTVAGTLNDFVSTSGIRVSVAMAAGVATEDVSISVRAASVIISATILVPGSNRSAVAEIIRTLERRLGTIEAASAVLGMMVLAVSAPTTVAAASAAPLPQSAVNTLLLLEQVESATGTATIVGRSYDAHPWEGVMPLAWRFACFPSGCAWPEPPPGHTLRVVNRTHAPLTPAQITARLFMQATFGPTSTMLATETGGNVGTWVAAQMTLPPTLLRVAWRRGANPRAPVDSAVGRGRTACAVGSRWLRYAFTRGDEGQPLAHTLTGVLYTLSLDGVVRTEVAVAAFNLSAAMAPHLICLVAERSGGDVRIGADCTGCGTSSGCTASTVTLPNPPIAFAVPPPAHRIAILGGSTLAPAAPEAQSNPSGVPRPETRVPDSEVLVTTAIDASCTLDDHGQSGAVFMQRAGAYYQHDRRLELLDNTLMGPVDDTGGASALRLCPTVAKNFVNSPTCRHAATCAPVRYQSAQVTLNATTLREWYELAGRYVYVVEGLRLNDPENVSPCAGNSRDATSRWVRADAPCEAETPLDTSSRDALVTALRNTSDMNVLVRDVVATCADTSAVAVGANLTVDGECFTHVHPDHLSVFDFTRAHLSTAFRTHPSTAPM